MGDSVMPGRIQEFIEFWADDFIDYCILDHFDETWECFEGSRDRANSRVGACLIHCEQGVNRSGALATAVHMRYSQRTGKVASSPESLLAQSWSFVAQRCGGSRGIVTNEGFQKQLLLFARMGCFWWRSISSVSSLWQTPIERLMAAFRAFVNDIAVEVVDTSPQVPSANRQALIIYIRDGVMRGEKQVNSTFELSNGAEVKAAKRV